MGIKIFKLFSKEKKELSEDEKLFKILKMIPRGDRKSYLDFANKNILSVGIASEEIKAEEKKEFKKLKEIKNKRKR